MGIRLRLGPFTFGRRGARLSLWRRGTGVSIPLSRRRKRSFGKVRFGPFSWYVGGSPATRAYKRDNHAERDSGQPRVDSYEEMAIQAFRADQQFLEKLRQHGVPWRGVQEQLKERLPENLNDRDSIAYKLVPTAMDALVAERNAVWRTERRPSKSAKGFTTWIVILDSDA